MRRNFTRSVRPAKKRSSRPAADVFYAIADPTRRGLLDLLSANQESVNSLAGRFAMSRPAISQHLNILLQARLVRARRIGRERHYSLNSKPLEQIHDWTAHYERFWTRKLAALGDHLRKRK
ncbi:MAG: metalloregulator ArsR/SmtB family transcription factor [Candidatus Acidiferrales bacterium]